MISISLKELVEVGAHFGHQTHRWNPKMRPFIYGERHGVHIINLQKTVPLFKSAIEFIIETVANGGDVLFVGTKKQARDVIAEQASLAGMHFVNDRWMGGTLTNFQTIKSSIDKLIAMEERRDKGDYASLKKKERLGIDRQIVKLSASLGGIRALKGVPSVIVIVDPKCERIAINEAKVLDIPLVAMADTNCDPDPIDYVVPANDDAVRSVRYFLEKIREACEIGVGMRDGRIQTRIEEGKREPRANDRRRDQVRTGKGANARAYTRGAETSAASVEEAKGGTYSAPAETATEDVAVADTTQSESAE